MGGEQVSGLRSQVSGKAKPNIVGVTGITALILLEFQA
jgi:hypothetical protein